MAERGTALVSDSPRRTAIGRQARADIRERISYRALVEFGVDGACEGCTRAVGLPRMGCCDTLDGEVRMRSLRPVLVIVLTCTTFAVTAMESAPRSGAAPDSATANTDPTGAHVEIDHRDHTWRETRASGGSGDAADGGCRRRWIPSGAYELRKTPAGDYRHVPLQTPQPGPEYQPYQVWCDDAYLGTVWIRPQQFGVNPLDIAERLVRDLPYPAATVGANPGARGLTGLETWFWVEGYTGAPIADVVTEFGRSVEVEATPDTVSWDFGDGTTTNGLGMGTPPPGRSTVVHTFETRARPAFPVRAVMRLAVRWRLDGGPWQELRPVARTAVRAYPVVESRAALVPSK